MLSTHFVEPFFCFGATSDPFVSVERRLANLRILQSGVTWNRKEKFDGRRGLHIESKGRAGGG